MIRKMMKTTGLLACAALAGVVGQTVMGAGADNVIPAGYVTLAGGRVLDTRGPLGTNPRLSAGQTVTVSTGVSGATAVAVNITLTDTVGPGFVAAWPAGPWPGTSVLNSTDAGENIANFVIVPVTPAGTFQLLTQQPAHLIVDVLGYMAGGSALVPAGFTATITGYGPGSTITSVIGTMTNGTGILRDLRADVRCPNGTLQTDSAFNIPPGETRGISVICSGVFTIGATVTVVEI